jgi:hypothetical protein
MALFSIIAMMLPKRARGSGSSPSDFDSVYNKSDSSSFERRIEMSEQELKKSVEAMQNLRNDLTSSKEKALAFLVEAGMVTTSGELAKPYRQGA